MEEIFQIELSEAEQAELNKSAEDVKVNMDKLASMQY
jgi:malate/lactate dehydrogenase